MSTGEVMFLILVLCAVTAFGTVLFYQDRRQRHDGI